MSAFVVDASVFLKLFVDEADSEQALRFFTHANDAEHTLLVPPLFQIEVLSVIARHRIHFDTVYDILATYLSTNMHEVAYSERLLRTALSISRHGNEREGHPSMYDALYHATAITQNCDFITADNRHYTKTRSLGHICLLANIA